MNRPGIKYRKLDDIFKDEEDIVLPKPSFKKPELRRNDLSVERMIRRESDNSLENVKVYKRDLLIHEAAHGGTVLMNALKKSIPSSAQNCKCECHGEEDNQSSASSNSTDTDQLLIYDTLKELNSYIRLRRKIIEEEEEEEVLQADWRYMAMVIDRFCLYIFSFATVLSMILIFFAIGRASPNELY
uniref:Neurotransmitter-gated ion-channel transmembrane domain-containing protein n=1 Tax=Panagrolaimus davidi TaxID=227884 RepID=A0A914P5T1_9BILA